MTCIAQIEDIHVFQAQIDALAHLSTAELEDRLAKIETLGKKCAEKLARGETGEFAGTCVRRGRHVATGSNEVTYNTNRRAWAVTRVALYKRAE